MRTTSGVVITAFGMVLVLVVVPIGLQLPLLSLGVLAAALIMFFAALAPSYAVGAWLTVILFAPFWTTIYVGGNAIGPSFLSIPVSLGLTARAIHESARDGSGRIRWLDVSVIAGVALTIVAQLGFGQQSFLVTNVVVALFGGYVIGRFARASVGRVFAVLSVILAIWGVIEFTAAWHAFTTWFAEIGGLGPAIQVRGGIGRSEATLGHAIAYGATLTAALPFTRTFRHPLILQLILLAGVLTSLSRGPILAAILTFAIMLFTERSTANRLRSTLLLIGGVAVSFVLFSSLYEGSGQEELESSSSARDDQLLALSATNFFGPATGTQWDSMSSRYVTNGISIIDSTYLRFALDFGWLVTVLLLLPVVVAAICVLRRRSGPATVALTGQLPILLVTSMITQWQTVLFFLMGMMVAEFARNATDTRRANSSESVQLAGTLGKTAGSAAPG